MLELQYLHVYSEELPINIDRQAQSHKRTNDTVRNLNHLLTQKQT